jgi:hypothetical protein
VPLTIFLAPEIGPFTLLFALTLCLLVCFLAFSLVAFRTLSISIHDTLRCSKPYVSSPLRYSTVVSHLQERRVQ